MMITQRRKWLFLLYAESERIDIWVGLWRTSMIFLGGKGEEEEEFLVEETAWNYVIYSFNKHSLSSYYVSSIKLHMEL